MYKLVLGITFGILFFSDTAMATCTAVTHFTNGSTADANAVNSNFDNLNTCTAPLAGASFTGSVGIGVTPTFVLDVEAGSAAGATMARFDATATTGAGLRVSASGTT